MTCRIHGVVNSPEHEYITQTGEVRWYASTADIGHIAVCYDTGLETPVTARGPSRKGEERRKCEASGNSCILSFRGGH